MTFTQEEVTQIKNYLLEIPGKYGLPLLQLIAKKEQDVLHQVPPVERPHEPVPQEK